MKKYPIFVLSSFLLTAAIYVGSSWLLFCGDWTAAKWCTAAEYVVGYSSYVLFPINPGALPRSLLFISFLPLSTFLFLLQLYIAHRLRIRRFGKAR